MASDTPPAPPPRPGADRRQVRAWCLYDFGNSGFAVLFPVMYGVYFQDQVVGGTAGVARWGQLVSASMLLVALSAPFLGGIADHAGVRKRMLAVYTAVGVLAVFALTTVAPGMAVWGFAIGVVALVAFEGGFAFYNAYLPEIAPPDQHGRISARGFAWGYAGSLLALGLAIACVQAGWFAGVWIACALQWGLGALPAFRHLPADRRAGMSVLQAGRHGLATTWQTLKAVWGMRPLRWFLIAYFFYMDGVLTVVHFAGPYAKGELGFEQTELILMIAVVQVAALVGALVMARPTDVRGPRWVVRVLLVWWCGVVVVAFFARNKPLFFVVACLAGLGLGSIQAASRAFMSRLVPAGLEAELFGFYALCGKSGAILGPLTFGLLAQAFDSQRPAVLSVAALYLLGLLLIARVPRDALEGRDPAAAVS